VHFHDFVDNFAMVACENGDLVGFWYDGLQSLEDDQLIQHVIYQAGEPI
jgi:hypothetical protein